MLPLDPSLDRQDDRNDCGWRALGFAVLEQAATDVQRLRAAGGIVNGRALEPWPTKVNTNGHTVGVKLYANYGGASRVKDLIHFFRSDLLGKWLIMLDSDLKPEDIRRGLGL